MGTICYIGYGQDIKGRGGCRIKRTGGNSLSSPGKSPLVPTPGGGKGQRRKNHLMQRVKGVRNGKCTMRALRSIRAGLLQGKPDHRKARGEGGRGQLALEEIPEKKTISCGGPVERSGQCM